VIELRKLLLIVSFAVSVYAHAEPNDGLIKLQQMQLAMATLNYAGTIAFMENGQLDIMKYFHAAKEGVEQERLMSLNSPMREVIRDSGTVSCTFKDSHKKIVNHRPVSQSFIIDLPKNLSRLAHWYEILISGEESVAMRPALVVDIQPRDNFRYSRRVWLDKETNLPLKVEVYGAEGRTLEQVVFTDLAVVEQIPFVNQHQQNETSEVQHIHQMHSEPFDQASFELENLPAGFEKVFFTRMSMHKSGKPVDHLLLSDGFSSISIYLDDHGEDIQEGLHSVGSVHSYTRFFHDRQATVMGEVPASTVQFVAKGIRFQR
jgi:sigma-E factor negative regulatory protein RseB